MLQSSKSTCLGEEQRLRVKVQSAAHLQQLRELEVVQAVLTVRAKVGADVGRGEVKGNGSVYGGSSENLLEVICTVSVPVHMCICMCLYVHVYMCEYIIY